jgi:hypothetical protein
MNTNQLLFEVINKVGGDMPTRIDTMVNVLHVAEELAGELSNLSHSFKEDYEDLARTSPKSMEDKKWAKQYAKDAETFCQLAHDLAKLRTKYVKKLSL